MDSGVHETEDAFDSLEERFNAMKTPFRNAAAAVTTGLMLVAGAVAPVQLSAQDADDTENRGRQIMPEAPPIGDGEMEDFAEVYLVIAEIREDFEHELEEIADPEQARALQRETTEQIRGVVTGSPLTVERYTQIGQILNVDPEQRAEFQALVREMREDDDTGEPIG